MNRSEPEPRSGSASGWDDGTALLAGRWTATPRPRRWTMIAAAAGVLVAVVLAALAARARPPTVVRTVTAAPTANAPTVDASGCPAVIECEVTGGLPVAAQVAAVRAAFPDARVEGSSTTSERDTGQLLRTLLVVRIGDGDSLAVWSGCVPGTATPVDRTENAARIRLSLGGNTLVMSRLLSIHRHGAPGCSVVVEVDSSGDGFRYRDAATRLAADPRLQVGR